MAKVVTKEWTSGFFLFDIGLFQGCVLSTILLNLLQPLREKHGFLLKQVNTRTLADAYADDLVLVTKDTKENQICCDKSVEWLNWTDTMKAKPPKCVSFAMKRFNDCKNGLFEQYIKMSRTHLSTRSLPLQGSP